MVVLFWVAEPAETSGQGKVRDAIISILGCEWPLTAKSIWFRVRKRFALNVSYQAVHTALKKLVENGIVVKEESEYCLDVAWIKKIKAFSLNLEKAYSENSFEARLRRLGKGA